MILFTAAMKQAARRITSSVTLRLLFELPDHLNFIDFRMVRTQDIADALNTGTGNISRSMRELLELGIIEREGKGPRTAWRFSSDWGWNGSADQYHAFRAGRLRGKRPPGAPSPVAECIIQAAMTPVVPQRTARNSRLLLIDNAPTPADAQLSRNKRPTT